MENTVALGTRPSETFANIWRKKVLGGGVGHVCVLLSSTQESTCCTHLFLGFFV